MITEQGHVKLMDFGIARALGEPPPTAANAFLEGGRDGSLPLAARTRTVLGTPQYMAPEMEQGVVSKECDVYALGVCLYELATGRLPFSTTLQKAALELTPASAIASGLPDSIDALVRESLQPDPVQRLKSPREFLAKLEAAAAVPARA
jgi:serine/threonine-protein kinase